MGWISVYTGAIPIRTPLSSATVSAASAMICPRLPMPWGRALQLMRMNGSPIAVPCTITNHHELYKIVRSPKYEGFSPSRGTGMTGFFRSHRETAYSKKEEVHRPVPPDERKGKGDRLP